MTSPFYHQDQTPRFAIADAAGTIPLVAEANLVTHADGFKYPMPGHGLRIPLIAERPSKGPILIGDDNLFFADYEGGLHIRSLEAAGLSDIHATLAFTHKGLPGGAPDIVSYRQHELTAYHNVTATIPMSAFSSRAIVPMPQATTGIITIAAELILHATNTADGSPREMQYDQLAFNRARATYYQFRRPGEYPTITSIPGSDPDDDMPTDLLTTYNVVQALRARLAARPFENFDLHNKCHPAADVPDAEKITNERPFIAVIYKGTRFDAIPALSGEMESATDTFGIIIADTRKISDTFGAAAKTAERLQKIRDHIAWLVADRPLINSDNYFPAKITTFTPASIAEGEIMGIEIEIAQPYRLNRLGFDDNFADITSVHIDTTPGRQRPGREQTELVIPLPPEE